METLNNGVGMKKTTYWRPITQRKVLLELSKYHSNGPFLSHSDKNRAHPTPFEPPAVAWKYKDS
jgi:hypothetical protein